MSRGGAEVLTEAICPQGGGGGGGGGEGASLWFDTRSVRPCPERRSPAPPRGAPWKPPTSSSLRVWGGEESGQRRRHQPTNVSHSASDPLRGCASPLLSTPAAEVTCQCKASVMFLHPYKTGLGGGGNDSFGHFRGRAARRLREWEFTPGLTARRAGPQHVFLA